MKKNKITDNTLCLFLISMGIAAASLVICAFVMALIAYSGEDPTKKVATFSLLTLIISAAVSGIIISRMKGDGGVKLAGFGSLALMILLLVIALITEKGSVPPSAFMNYGCFVGISLLAAYLGRKREKRRKRR